MMMSSKIAKYWPIICVIDEKLQQNVSLISWKNDVSKCFSTKEI